MAQTAYYASFDPAQEPSPVTGWYDKNISYAQIPTNVVVVTDAQWAAHLVTLHGWTVSAQQTLLPPSVPTTGT